MPYNFSDRNILLIFFSHLIGSITLKIKKGKIHNKPFFMIFSNCTRNILDRSFPLINALPQWYARTKIAVPYDANPNDCMGCDDEDCPCPGDIWQKVTDMITNGDPEVLRWFMHEVSIIITSINAVCSLVRCSSLIKINFEHMYCYAIYLELVVKVQFWNFLKP